MKLKVKKKINKTIFLNYPKLFLNEINDKDPINNLITSFPEIKSIIDDNNPIPDKIKLIYFNRKKVHHILYDTEEMIPLSSNLIKNNISNYFYLMLLLKDNKDVVNYTYPFDFIKNINAELNNNKNNKLKSLIISKLIIDLISNYEDEETEELETIKNKNLEMIKNNLKDIETLNIKIDEKKLKNNTIDKIYIDILDILIEKNKNNNYKLLNELDLENINITKEMFNGLSKILEKIKNKYKIQKKEDFFDDNKINFYYVLVKYILKDQIYIYQFPFLLETKKQIIKIIKNNFPLNKFRKDIQSKLIDIIDYFIDSKYYNKYLNNNNYSTSTSTSNSNIYSNNNNVINIPSIKSSSTAQASKPNPNTTTEEDYAILKVENIIYKYHRSNSPKFIKELSNGNFLIGGQNNILTYYNNEFIKINNYIFDQKDKIPEYGKNQYYKMQQNIMETNESIKGKNEESIQVLDCSKFSLISYTITIKDKTIFLSQQKIFEYSCSGCYEKYNNNKIEYIVIGQKGLSHFEEFPSSKMEKKKLNDCKLEKNFKGSIK